MDSGSPNQPDPRPRVLGRNPKLEFEKFTLPNGLLGFQDSLDYFDPQGIGKPTWNVTTGQPGVASASLAAPFARQLTLGTLSPGETFVVTYTVHARSYVGLYDSAREPDPPPDEPKVSASASLTLQPHRPVAILSASLGHASQPSGVPSPSASL